MSGYWHYEHAEEEQQDLVHSSKIGKQVKQTIDLPLMGNLKCLKDDLRLEEQSRVLLRDESSFVNFSDLVEDSFEG